ncbi:MAG: adenosylcobinamide amidohydrolase [Myxococcota bacterium]
MSVADVIVEQEGDWLVARLPGAWRVASWGVVRGGLARADAVAWLGVRGDELGLHVDPEAFLRARLDAAGLAGAVGMLTAARVARYEQSVARDGDVSARALVTVGLTNARRAGDPASAAVTGTINLLVAVSEALSDEAMLEALGVATEARTVAVLEAGVTSPMSGLPASGTGTDCVVIAAPDGPGARWAGKHTAIGHVVGASVLAATRRATDAWLRRRPPPASSA